MVLALYKGLRNNYENVKKGNKEKEYCDMKFKKDQELEDKMVKTPALKHPIKECRYFEILPF